MTYGLISSKYQIVIPKDVRQAAGLKPGQRLIIYTKDNVIFMIPEIATSKLKGYCDGMDVSSVRDEEDRS